MDILLIPVCILMLAGSVWGWRQGYAAFDVTTAVWLIVLVDNAAMKSSEQLQSCQGLLSLTNTRGAAATAQ
jgi:hypothetical protein